MPFMPVSATPVESYLPPFDMRNATKASVVDGKNFFFDSEGPKSGFTTKILTPFPFGAPTDVQSIEIQDRVYVFTSDAILTWPRDQPYSWELLYAFASAIPENARAPWSAIFLEGNLYLAHPYRGLFSSPIEPGVDVLTLTPKTSFDIPGLISGIRGMAVVRGRPILVNEEAIQWGATGNLEDLTPSLGGAGFQLLSAFVEGEFLGLSSFQDGFMTWTTGGPVVSEFIDGDIVWDHYPLTTQEKPISHRAALRREDGSMIFLSRKGLMLVSGGTKVEQFSPEFNEYFLQYIESSTTNFNARQYWRLGYDSKREFIFLSESADGVLYHRAFVLAPTRNKWGLLNEPHYGMISPAPGIFGFVDQFGYARYIDEGSFMREVPPEDDSLVDRHYPRRQKQMRIPSSSAVSRAYVPDTTQQMIDFFPIRAGWYMPGEIYPAPAVPGSLDSYIDIGYVRTPEMTGLTAELLEIQEMLISTVPSSPGFAMDFTTEHKAEEFYPEEEDWDSASVITTEDIVEDLMTSTQPDEDYLQITPSVYEDWNDLVAYVAAYAAVEDEDWNVESGDEDWHGQNMDLIPHTFEVSWLGTSDGITFDETIPELARFLQETQLWTGMSSGAFHRIRIKANAWPAYYKVSLLNLRLQYGGRLT